MTKVLTVCAGWPFAVLVLLVVPAPSAWADDPGRQLGSRIEFKQHDDKGRMEILVNGKEALVYRYGDGVDLPHYFPVRSPSGQLLTVQQTDPYPHHRSVWFADTVRLAGQRQASFYNAFYSRVDRNDPKSPFRDRVRHVQFVPGKSDDFQADMSVKLLWEMNLTEPVLDETRHMRIAALDDGEYFVDFKFELAASYGEVEFESDAVHYAWPFVRMSPEFSVDRGGSITSSEGGINQSGTNNEVARWVDYSNTVNGQTEGLTLFSHPDNSHPHRWLTRDYGCFGPRRSDEQSGKKFAMKQGEQLTQRIGILVHRGDVQSGQVSKRFEMYSAGRL